MKNLFIVFTVFFISIFYTTSSASSQVKNNLLDQDGFLINQPLINKKINNKLDTDFAIKSEAIKGQLSVCEYDFKSLEVDLNTDALYYKNGDVVMVKGNIKNNNKYPLIDLTVKAQLVKKNNISDSKDRKNIIVDEFYLFKNMSIKGNGSFDVNYSKVLTSNITSGEYELHFYVYENGEFNLSGLNFSDNSPKSKAIFFVENNLTKDFYLDSKNIKVNNEAYSKENQINKYNIDKDIEIKIPLVNETDVAKNVNITYNLSSKDNVSGLGNKNIKTQKIKIGAKESKTLFYTIKNENDPIYYLNVIAQSESDKDVSVFDEKSIANIEIVAENIIGSKINFFGVDGYILKKNTTQKLFTCFGSVNNGFDKNIRKIETVLYDDKNNEISRNEYIGNFSPNNNAIITEFTTKKDVANFTIMSNIYDEKNNLIYSFEKKYSCDALDKDLCSKENKKTSPIINILLPIILLLSLIFLIIKKK